jgi:hypothetical protein
MFATPSKPVLAVSGTPPDSASVGRGRAARWLLPSPVSDRHAISVLLLGFFVEGATEAFQFIDRGNLGQGPVEYYTTLATTILGFYLMFLGFREWHAFHPKPARKTTIPWLLIQLFASASLSIGMWVGLHSRRLRAKYLFAWLFGMVATLVVLNVATVMQERAEATPPKRRWPWFGLGLFAGGTAMTAILGTALGGGAADFAPAWVVWPVGGLIVLAFGNFFFSLRKQAQPLGPWPSRALGWVGFGWSLAVATVAGLVVGDRSLLLLTEFATTWGALIASVAPIVVAMSPLCVSYALMIGAFGPALSRQRIAIP